MSDSCPVCLRYVCRAFEASKLSGLSPHWRYQPWANEIVSECETVRFDRNRVKPRFQETHCSQCGSTFGPGDHGYSDCDRHRDLHAKIAVALSWCDAEMRSVSLQSLRDLVRPLRPELADEISEAIQTGRVVVR